MLSTTPIEAFIVQLLESITRKTSAALEIEHLTRLFIVCVKVRFCREPQIKLQNYFRQPKRSDFGSNIFLCNTEND